MKPLFRLVIKIIGYGLQLNQFTNLYLVFIVQKKETYICREKFFHSLVNKYGKYTVYTDNGGTWYDEACNVIGLKHYVHSSIEKSLMERVKQYLKDRIESFDDYYPCMQK